MKLFDLNSFLAQKIKLPQNIFSGLKCIFLCQNSFRPKQQQQNSYSANSILNIEILNIEKKSPKKNYFGARFYLIDLSDKH